MLALALALGLGFTFLQNTSLLGLNKQHSILQANAGLKKGWVAQNRKGERTLITLKPSNVTQYTIKTACLSAFLHFMNQ